MPTQCVSPYKPVVARFTRVNDCGVPVTGVGSAQVTIDAFTSIAVTPAYEDGPRRLTRKASGDPCLNEQDVGFFNWLDEESKFCVLDPSLIQLVTGGTLLTNGATGTGVMMGEGVLSSRFSKEIWQTVGGTDACDPSGVTRYVYWAFPNEGDARIQAFTFDENAFEFSFTSRSRRASSLWTLGSSWLGGATWGPGKHYAFNITTVAPPTAVCGAVTI